MHGPTQAMHTFPCHAITSWARAAMEAPANWYMAHHQPCISSPMCRHARLRHGRAHAQAAVSHVCTCHPEQHGPRWAWTHMELGAFHKTCPCRPGSACARADRVDTDEGTRCLVNKALIFEWGYLPVWRTLILPNLGQDLQHPPECRKMQHRNEFNRRRSCAIDVLQYVHDLGHESSKDEICGSKVACKGRENSCRPQKSDSLIRIRFTELAFEICKARARICQCLDQEASIRCSSAGELDTLLHCIMAILKRHPCDCGGKGSGQWHCARHRPHVSTTET